VILVLGGQGQLGQELQRQAALRGEKLTALSRADCDIADTQAMTRAILGLWPRVVVNCAAYTAVDRAESEPDMASRINAEGARVVAGITNEAGLPLIHLSTDYVFDGTKAGAYVEDDPIAPLGAYGRSKAEGEANVRRMQRRHVILRTAWVYGAFGHNFLKTMLRLSGERDELRIVADQRGSPTGTAGLANAILDIAPKLHAARKSNDNSLWGTYHLTGPEPTTWHGFASEIVAMQAEFTGKRPPVTAIATSDFPTPARRPANSVLDCSRIRKAFGVELPPWREETARAVKELLGGS
jgi:dTDP-4-dehydrorhamnose reductase